MLYDYTRFYEFPQTVAENEWLEARLETLSVKETVILTAAAHRYPPESIVGAINLLASLPDYGIRCLVHDDEDLGRVYLAEAELNLPDIVIEHTDMEALGIAYEDQHPGEFVGGCYVIYPEDEPKLLYDGTNLAHFKDEGWSVKAKLASPSCPEGVWLRLPDYSEANDGDPDETALVLNKLGARTVQECTLLDARCVFPEAGDLMEQYDDPADLIYDGNNLGFLLDERAQGMRDYEQKLAAVLEYDGCQTLKDVIDCADEIRRFQFVMCDKLDDYARSELKKAGVPEVLIAGGVFDLDGFAKASLAQSGYQLDSTEQVYIKPRAEEHRMSEAPMIPQLQM